MSGKIRATRTEASIESVFLNGNDIQPSSYFRLLRRFRNLLQNESARRPCMESTMLFHIHEPGSIKGDVKSKHVS